MPLHQRPLFTSWIICIEQIDDLRYKLSANINCRRNQTICLAQATKACATQEQPTMLIFYIDDSGTNLGDKKHEYFVLGAFVIHSDQKALMDERLNAFKKQLVSWAAPEDVELKGRWLQHGEELFKTLNLDWPAKVRAFHDVAQIIDEIPCRVFVVLLHKPSLIESIESNEDLYRLAFWRLLDELDEDLKRENQAGLLMLDGQSDLHSHVSDRRFIDSYRRWAGSRTKEPGFVEL